MSFKQVELGRNGPKIAQLGFGAMSFAGFFGPTDEETSLATLDAAIKAGINFWDTANIYGMGVSETVIGKYLAAEKPDIVLATKGGIVPGPPRAIDNSASHLREELEKSLTRLQVDRVDLYYIHRHEPGRPIEEVVETLAGFIEEGLIGGYGLSEVMPGTLRRAHAIHPCRAVQNEYSLWTRLPELGLIDTCAELGTAFVAFSPLARGMIGETSVDPAQMSERDWRRVNPRFEEPNYSYNLAAIDAFRDYARSKGWKTAALALAWVMQRGDHVIPIPGTRTAAHLSEWLGAAEITLGPDELAEIAAILPAGFAHGDRYSDAQMMGVERYC